jgi:hypothetical protein
MFLYRAFFGITVAVNGRHVGISRVEGGSHSFQLQMLYGQESDYVELLETDSKERIYSPAKYTPPYHSRFLYLFYKLNKHRRIISCSRCDSFH